METIENSEVSKALDIAMTAALQDARLPRLTASEHASLVTIETVAIILDLEDVIRRTAELLAADRDAHGSRLIRTIAGQFPTQEGCDEKVPAHAAAG